ncbi:hypothetical protein M072_3801 [Bacteroides fragilis str. DS-208]|nr:hypothetical protein M072_3801 [Bacteroides fragilis str. DS-208]
MSRYGWQSFAWNNKRPEYVIWYFYNYQIGHIRGLLLMGQAGITLFIIGGFIFR